MLAYGFDLFEVIDVVTSVVHCDIADRLRRTFRVDAERARKLRECGHAVVLLRPSQVRPFARGNKTDRSDAKALVEAYRCGEIRPVPVKTPEQQVLTSLHRLREGWMAERTARLNALRALLREQGVFIRVGAREVVPAVWALIEDADSGLAMPLRAVFAEACHEIREIERRLDLVEHELAALARLRGSPGPCP